MEMMMDDGNVIDLTERRNAAAQPDPEFVRKDEYGRPLYCFTLSYQMDGSTYATEVWAYNIDEAKKRVQAMRETLTYEGQLFWCIPA
jgi:hypothetical protein